MDHASPPQSETGRDSPGVLLFPPTIPAATLVLGALLSWLAPLDVLARIAPSWRHGIGAALFVAGLLVAGSGIRALRRHGTNVNPAEPVVTVVTDGIYARSRNPIYVGGFVALAGIAGAFALDWVLLLFVPALALLHYGIVLREERYLERKFGEPYRHYKDAVRRYL